MKPIRLGLLVLLGFLATAFAGNSGSDATDVRKLLRYADLYGVAVQGSSLWAVGAKGSIFHSPDLGGRWEMQPSGVKNELYAVCFADAQQGWAVGRLGVILHTADGGRRWEVQQRATPDRETNLLNVHFVNREKGWAVGEWAEIVSTSDGGRTWSRASLGEDKFLYGVHFVDENYGWVVGEAGLIAHTKDGGRSWAKQVSPEKEKSLFAVYFSDREKGWACGIDGILLGTRDGGNTWLRVPGVPAQESLYAMEYVGDQLIAIGKKGRVLRWKESDGSEAWSAAHGLPAVYHWLMALSRSGSNAAIVGAKGTILVSRDGGASWRFAGS